MFYRRCPEGEGGAWREAKKDGDGTRSPGGSEGEALRTKIRSGGMYAARSIFAEVSLPSGSKNAFLADFAPGSAATAKSEIVTHLIQMLEEAFE